MGQNGEYQQSDVNETAMNLYFGPRLSPTQLPYPTAPRYNPSNGQNQANSISETISMSPTYLPQSLPTLPSAPEYHNLNRNDNEQNGLILSSTHLPYSIAPDDAPPPYPGNPNGAWINGSWVSNL